MGYVVLFVIFLLVMQFAFFLLPYLLPIFLIVWLISLFKKPSIRVYTNTYSYEDMSDRSRQSGSYRNPGMIQTRKPLEDSIDVEFTEREDEEA